MPEQFYLTNQMVDNLNDDGLSQRYYSMIYCNQINPNKWSKIYHRDDATPIYWFIKCQKYLLNSVEGLDPQMRCRYISVLFRLILQYKFVLNYPKFAQFKITSIRKAHELREDPACTEECKLTLGLYLNVVDVIG